MKVLGQRHRPDLAIRIGCIAAGFVLAFAGFAQAQPLNENWTVTVNGQTVQVQANGKFRIPNVAAADNFGSGGPGTAPDFMSDDFLRVIGQTNEDGVIKYVFTDAFRLEQAGTKTFSDSDFNYTTVPPPLPESIMLTTDPTIFEVGQTSQLTTIATLANGVEQDVTPTSEWTTYRVSNPAIASVDDNGLLTGLAPGVVLVSASNGGAISARALLVQAPSPTTTVAGVTMLSDGTRVPGVNVEVVGTGLSAVSGADASFTIPDVPADQGPLDLFCEVTIGPDTLVAEVMGLVPMADAFTDAGIINMSGGSTFFATDAFVDSGAEATSIVLIDTEINVGAWSFGLCHESTELTLVDAEATALLATIDQGTPADFLAIDFVPFGAGTDGVTMAVVVDVFGVGFLPVGTGYEVLRANYTVLGGPGSTSDVCFCDTIGVASPVATVISDVGGTVFTPNTSCGTLEANP